MNPANQNSTEALRGEILAESSRTANEIIRLARQAAEVLLTNAKAEAEKIRQEKSDRVEAEIQRRLELMLATIPVESERRRLVKIEAVLESIREAAGQQIKARNFDQREIITTLAAEAIGRMTGTDFVLKIPAADARFSIDELTAEISRRTGRPLLKLSISSDPSMTDSGVMVEASDGVRSWDNRLPARLERLWPELRRQIASHILPKTAGEPQEGGI